MFSTLFCHWIPSQHDWGCICYARYGEYGCFINHPVFCLTFLGSTFCFHPLFFRHRGGGLRIFLTHSVRSLSKQCPFVVSLACTVCSVSSLVKAQKCWCGVSEGNWQCCGNSLVEPEIDFLPGPGRMHPCLGKTMIRVCRHPHIRWSYIPVVQWDNGSNRMVR